MSIEDTFRNIVRAEIQPILEQLAGTLPLLLDREGAALKLGISLATFDNMRKHPGFPRPVPMPECKYPRWDARDIIAWVDRQKETAA